MTEVLIRHKLRKNVNEWDGVLVMVGSAESLIKHTLPFTLPGQRQLTIFEV